MTLEEHLKMVIGELIMKVASQAAQIDALTAQLPAKPAADAGKSATGDAAKPVD